jgi:hypothetical protein
VVTVKLTVIESPFQYLHADASDRAIGLIRNITYARLAVRDSLNRGEVPCCSHLLFTQPLVLDDDTPTERATGIAAGLALGERADQTAAYTDMGISSGMNEGISRAGRAGRPVHIRSVLGWENAASEDPGETLIRLGLYSGDVLEELRLLSGRRGVITVFGPVPSGREFLQAPQLRQLKK